jgi:CubicO group peptidase (beta-lactamase class C family)
MNTTLRRRSTAAPALLLALLGATATAGPTADAPLPSTTPAAAGLSVERLARLDRYVEGEIAAGRKAGAVVLIARRGKVAYVKAYGEADVQSHRPMPTDALFRIHSMTKPITSVALLTLYEQGKFQLSDPLEKYLPAFKGVKVYKGTGPSGEMELEDATRPITIEDVFRHTAGFTYGYFGDTPVDRAYRAAGVGYGEVASVGELADKLATMPLLYQPGTVWHYGFAHDVQAHLVEVLSGKRFDAYCQQVIFGPLGMKDTVFGVPAARKARFASIYHPDGAGRILPGDGMKGDGDAYAAGTGRPFGGTSVATTAADYLRFAEMLRNGGRLGHVRILSRKTVELMTADHLGPSIRPVWPGEGYGLGVGVVTSPAEYRQLASVGEFRWSGYATTGMWIDPREQLVAIVMAQYQPEDFTFLEYATTLVYQAIVD